MSPQAKKIFKSTVKAGFSLMEISFIMVLIGVVITPIILNQTAQNALYSQELKSLENASLSDTQLLELLENQAKKADLVKEISEKMAELALGAKIVNANVASQEELYDPLATANGNYLNTLDTFFQNVATVGPPVYKYKLPNETDEKITTPQKTFFLKTSNGKYVPLFTYNWEFRDQSSNTNDENQNTSTGTYLVRAELKVYKIASPVAQTALTTVPETVQTNSITSNLNVRNDVQVTALKAKMPRVLINFTFDMSRGACYSPATTQYATRLARGTTSWTTLDFISYSGSAQGLLCAPYFEPSTNNTPSASPWADGNVEASGVLKPTWYDIYYNDGQLFWTNGTGPKTSKEQSVTTPDTAMGFASFLDGSLWRMPKVNGYPDHTVMGTPTTPVNNDTYTLRKPILHVPTILNPQNFPEGDFDKTALRYIRCYNYEFGDGISGRPLKQQGPLQNFSAPNAFWFADFYGPPSTIPITTPDSRWQQFNCAQYNTFWLTPKNSLLPGRTNQAGSYFFVRQSAGNLVQEDYHTLEAARMAISDDMDTIGGDNGGSPVAKFNTSELGSNEAVGSLESNSDGTTENARWISGVEFQRSAALISMFSLLDRPTDYKNMFEVSVMLNEPLAATSLTGLTTYKRYPYDDITPNTDPRLEKAKLGPANPPSLQTVMKHLYGMNRLLGFSGNAGDANFRHLANRATFDVKQSIIDFRAMLKETAQLTCRKDLSIALTATADNRCNNHADSEWAKHLGYDHYVNIIFFPSDMSGNSERTLTSSHKNADGTLLSTSTTTLQNDLTSMIPDNIHNDFAPSSDPFKDKITYVLVVHKDQHEQLKGRVEWLRNEMRSKGVPVVYEEVGSVKDYERFFNGDLLQLFKEKSEGGTAATGEFNNMEADDYSY
ncbi:MAG: hypothetical protein ACK5T0_07675 [Vampirovibrionales bacterium]